MMLFFPPPFQLLSTNCAGSGGDKARPDTFLSAALLLHGWASHTYLLGRADVGTALLAAWLQPHDPAPSPPRWDVDVRQGISFVLRQEKP